MIHPIPFRRLAWRWTDWIAIFSAHSYDYIKPSKEERMKIAIVSIFAVAMAFLETTVVVYLRALYYPGGFDFPLSAMDPSMLKIEILREAATLIMLLNVGWLNGRNPSEKLAWFIYSFAVWDIFYYVFLKVILDWPSSLFSWDILFLIPTMWVGPVLAPLILSATMILLALMLLYFKRTARPAEIRGAEWFLLIFGSLIVIFTFCHDFLSFGLSHMSFRQMWDLIVQGQSSALAFGYIPRDFSWVLFGAGESLLLYAILRLAKRKVE